MDLAQLRATGRAIKTTKVGSLGRPEMQLTPGVGVSGSAYKVPADIKEVIKAAGLDPALERQLMEDLATMAVSKPQDPYAFLAESMAKLAGGALELKEVIKAAGLDLSLERQLMELGATMAVLKPIDPYAFLAEAMAKLAGGAKAAP